jgi:hypothetical protein
MTQMTETSDRIRTVVHEVLGKTKAPPAEPDPTYLSPDVRMQDRRVHARGGKRLTIYRYRRTADCAAARAGLNIEK